MKICKNKLKAMKKKSLKHSPKNNEPFRKSKILFKNNN